MGRCLTFEVFGNLDEGPVPNSVRRRIQIAADMLTHHFTWTSQSLVIDFTDRPVISYATIPPDPWQALLGDGVCEVDDDEWNALLLIRYMRWVSTQVPTRTVRVIDEGGFIIADFAVFRDGEVSLDSPLVASQTQRYRENDRWELLCKFEKGVQRACNGEFFNAYRAIDYADRKEIAGLGLTPNELAKLTLDDVADKLTFPWQTDWLTSPIEF